MPYFEPDFKKGDSESSGFFRPFKNLKTLFKNKSLPLASYPVETISGKIEAEPDHPEYEQRLFMKAMADVTPVPRGKYIENDFEIRQISSYDKEQDRNIFDDHTEYESILRLKRLVENGEGFVVANTPEYIEGRGYCDNPEITDRLHRGDFSIQAHIDLHGLSSEAAEDVFDRFIKDTIDAGKRAVLIVHGRGLSSPVKPVLKNKVQDWLTRGPWRKWVIAFSSARSCDGGAGATYVLLRRRPLTKRFRKNKKRGMKEKK